MVFSVQVASIDTFFSKNMEIGKKVILPEPCEQSGLKSIDVSLMMIRWRHCSTLIQKSRVNIVSIESFLDIMMIIFFLQIISLQMIMQIKIVFLKLCMILFRCQKTFFR